MGDGSSVTLAASESIAEHYNGKLAGPAVWSEPLDLSLFGTAAANSADPVVDPCEAGGSASLCAAWDFSKSATAMDDNGGQMLTAELVDTGPQSLNGVMMNAPTQGSVGPRWQESGVSGMGFGEEHCWRHAPSLYNAVHFHEDDTADAGCKS